LAANVFNLSEQDVFIVGNSLTHASIIRPSDFKGQRMWRIAEKQDVNSVLFGKCMMQNTCMME